ncbi:MAG: hypothetical protein IJD59_08330 [Clostridia bacterium]|nr:hypothetical protein [Clostridia bacterium]
MKKGLIKYSLLWLVALGLFNAAAFLIPNDLGSSSFWIGYGAISGAFVLQLISTAWFIGKDLLQKRIGKIPVPVFCIFGLVTLLTVSVVWAITTQVVVIVVCYLIVAAQYGANIVSAVGAGNAGAATGFVAELKKSAEALAQKASDGELQALTEEVCNAVRASDTYSDPNGALAGVENKILAAMEKFSVDVEASDVESAKVSAKQLLNYIKERNTKCKILK